MAQQKPLVLESMEEGTKGKKTIFIGGIGDDVDETVIYEHFAAFGVCSVSRQLYTKRSETAGDIIEVQLPPAPANPSKPTGKQTKMNNFLHADYP